MTIAALAIVPIAAPLVSVFVAEPLLLLAGLGVAVLSTTIPFTFEFEALKRLPTLTYGVLVSLEPAVTVLVGAVLLSERIGVQGFIAGACVTIASLGMTLGDRLAAKG